MRFAEIKTPDKPIPELEASIVAARELAVARNHNYIGTEDWLNPSVLTGACIRTGALVPSGSRMQPH